MDELLARLAAEGVLINNLFQLDDGRWQCNLRRTDFTGWGVAETAQEAIIASLGTQFERAKPKPQKLSLEDLGL